VKRRLLTLFAACLLALSATVPAAGSDLAGDLKDVRDRISDLKAQIDATKGERTELAQQLSDAADDLAAAEADVDAANAELDRISLLLEIKQVDLAQVQAELAEKLDALAAIRDDLDGARADAQQWALKAYMGGGASQPSIAFSAGYLSQVAVGVAYLDVLAQHSSSAGDRYQALADAEERTSAGVRAVESKLAGEVEALHSLGAEVSKQRIELVRKQGELEAAYEAQRALVDEIEAEIKEFESELAGYERQESSIRAKIAASTKTSSPTVSAGGWVRPVPGAISSGFGMRIHPITHQRRMHNGVDMNASQGDPIHAAKSGTVILAGVKGGYGNTIMIDHGGGFVTLYAHQSKLGAKVGDKVAAGEVIGYIGSTGQSTAPHLHFEIRVNGSPVDPQKYI